MFTLLASCLAAFFCGPTVDDTTAPWLWGGLRPGVHDVGFARTTISHDSEQIIVDTWYPAQPGTSERLRFVDYLRLSDDLRGATSSFPNTPESLALTLSNVVSGDVNGVPRDVVERINASIMAARRDARPADRRFPLVLWTPRYATTVAQAVLSEYLASHGFVVAFARPKSGGRRPFELPSYDAKEAELRARVEDMRAVITHLARRVEVNASTIGVLAWSYTGEMATSLQMREPRVKLVAGLSTTLVNDWVYQPAEALSAVDPSRLDAAYAVLVQRGAAAAPRPPLLDRIGVSYFIEWPGLAHGSFNALEGHLPSLLGLPRVQPWSQSSTAGAEGYEAVAAVTLRLLRHHVRDRESRSLASPALLSGIPERVAVSSR